MSGFPKVYLSAAMDWFWRLGRLSRAGRPLEFFGYIMQRSIIRIRLPLEPS
jgi:hypothetical protein